MSSGFISPKPPSAGKIVFSEKQVMRADAHRYRQAVLLRLREKIDFVFAADVQEVGRLTVLAHKVQNVRHSFFFGVNGDQTIGRPGAVMALSHGAGIDQQVSGSRVVIDLKPADA